MDNLNLRHWRFLRSYRQATGQEYQPLRKDLSFLPHHKTPVWPIAVVLGILLFIVACGGGL